MTVSVTAARMKEIDRRASEEFHVPALILMENAGRSVADLMTSCVERGLTGILCGKGNNGGDGMVTARHLAIRGWRVRIFLTVNDGELHGDAALNLKMARAFGIPVSVLPEEGMNAWMSAVAECSVLVDALLGIGLKGELREPYREVIDRVNQLNKKIVAVDIPSGLQGDTGEVLGSAVHATLTGTLGALKPGLQHPNAREYTGRVEVLEISLPPALLTPDPG